MNKRVTLIISNFLFLALTCFGQDTEAEMADVMRGNGKIYTVVVVLGIVLVGLFIYLFLTERKLASLEEQIKKS